MSETCKTSNNKTINH